MAQPKKIKVGYIADENPKAKTMRPEQFVDARFIKELDDGGYIDALYKGKTR